MRILILFIPFGLKKMNDLVVISNNITNTFAGLITSNFGPDVARGQPVLLR
jgi:hypothetical protein